MRRPLKCIALTLDDVNLDKLPEVNLENDSQRHMRQAKDEVADLDEILPEWPSGVDATKREGLAILRDLVGAVKASKLAGVLERGD